MGETLARESIVLLAVLVRTVYFVIIDAELRPIFAKPQSLFAKRRQQQPPGDPPPPLLLPSPPNMPWEGSGRCLRPAPAVTRPRPSAPPAHYHSTRVQRHSPPLPSCRQPPPSRLAVHEMGRGAANGCGRLTRPYPPPGHRRNVYLEQMRGAGKRRRHVSRLHDHAVNSRGGVLRYQEGDTHGCSQVSPVRRPPGSRRLTETGRKGAPPTVTGDVHTSATPRAF